MEYNSRKDSVNIFKDVPLSYSDNPYILKWWTDKHDKILEESIRKNQWVYDEELTPNIINNTPSKYLETWKHKDPVCHRYAWYNVLWYFALSRAIRLNLTDLIREPIWKICPICSMEFVEDSLGYNEVRRLGLNQIDICGPCISERIRFDGHRRAKKKEILEYIRNLTELLGRVPPQDFGTGVHDFRHRFQLRTKRPYIHRWRNLQTIHIIEIIYRLARFLLAPDLPFVDCLFGDIGRAIPAIRRGLAQDICHPGHGPARFQIDRLPVAQPDR